jgi:hypothetical protein
MSGTAFVRRRFALRRLFAGDPPIADKSTTLATAAYTTVEVLPPHRCMQRSEGLIVRLLAWKYDYGQSLHATPKTGAGRKCRPPERPEASRRMKAYWAARRRGGLYQCASAGDSLSRG